MIEMAQESPLQKNQSIARSFDVFAQTFPQIKTHAHIFLTNKKHIKLQISIKQLRIWYAQNIKITNNTYIPVS